MGTQSDPCCSSATPSLTLNPKTYRLQRGSYVAPSSPSSFSSPLLKTAAQDGGVQDQAELPRGLRGSDQQADQHGILRLLCLSLHVFLLLARRPGPVSPRTHKVGASADYTAPSATDSDTSVLLQYKEGSDYKLALNMQQYSPDDITIKLNGRTLTIEAAGHGEQFKQRHVIPDNIDLD